MTSARRWSIFAAAWLASAIVVLFLLAIPFQQSPLTFWILWFGYALLTAFFGAVLTILAGSGRRVS